MDFSRLFSFFTNPWNNSEQEPSNLPFPTSSRDPFLEKLRTSHSNSPEVEEPRNPERASNGHLERFCKDCKFYGYNPQSYQFARLGQTGVSHKIASIPEHNCSEGSFRDPVTGELKLIDCTIRRKLHVPHDYCGPEGKKWEPKV